MNKEKQIEEMADTINEMDEPNAHYYDRNLKEHEAFADCFTIAKHLYEKGYRRISDDHQRQGTCYALGCQMAAGLKKDVAREIFEEIEKTLNRKLARSKPRYEELNCNEGSLSIWGHKDMGYFQGIISTAEDIQDFIAELKKKYTEDGK